MLSIYFRHYSRDSQIISNDFKQLRKRQKPLDLTQPVARTLIKLKNELTKTVATNKDSCLLWCIQMRTNVSKI